MAQRSPADRFWAKVDRNGPIPEQCPDLGPCHVWTAALWKDRGGYGKFQAGTSRATARPIQAHRFAWELAHGVIPDGMVVLHRCDNPRCVRLSHLRLGTYAENTADMMAKGRHPTQRGRRLAHRLTEDQIREIRWRASQGELHRSIASDFDLAPGYVGYVVRRTVWKNVA